MSTTTRRPASFPLYAIIAELRAIEDLIDDSGGEITDEIGRALDEIAATAEAKIEAIALMVKERKKTAEMAREAARELAERARSIEASADGLAAYLIRNMQTAGIDKVKTARATVWHQLAAPSVEWQDEMDRLPPEFLRIKTEVDKAKAIEVVKDGGKLPAGFVVKRSTFLQVRVS